jgi:hypothetical protein
MSNKTIEFFQNEIMLSWKAVMNYEQQLRDIGHDKIIEDCIAMEKEKVYHLSTALNQLETSVNQAKAILKDAGYYVDNLWHVDDVKSLKSMKDDDAYAILDTILSGDYIIEDIANSINQATQTL